MRVLKWLDQYFEEAVLVVFLVIMMIIMGLQVTARYVFSSSLSWSEEITRYLFIWSGFLSASFCIKNGVSVKIDQLVRLLPERLFHIVKAFTYVIELIFFAYMIPFAYKYVSSAIVSKQLSPACGIPIYLIQFATIFSFSLCVFRLAEKLILRIKTLIHLGKEAK
ncbi:MAG: TRAP transporter small permease [Anaerostipes sp.]|nr:TRAP transporter small permease [Anaerostipes sp.]MDD3745402.1 TRAP transporter small permease [Anaerostipes sp.]